MKKRILPLLTAIAAILCTSSVFASDALAGKYAELEKTDLDGKTNHYFEIVGEYRHAAPMIFDFKSGAVSGRIADFDGDGSDELLVVYAENTDLDDDLYLQMYEEKDGKAELAASSDKITNFVSGEKGGGCVFIKKVDGKDRIFMQYTGEVNSYADGAEVQIKGFDYDGSKFNTVLDIETGGSAADFNEEEAQQFKNIGLEDTYASFEPDEYEGETVYHFNPYYGGLNIGAIEKDKEMLTDITMTTNIFDIFENIDWEKEDERMDAAVKTGLMTVKVEDKTAIKAVATKTEDKDPNEIWVYLNGEKMTFDSEPYIENGTTRVPMRAIFEGLGASVDYAGETKTVTAQKGDTKIELVIGSDNALVNGKENKLLVPAEIKNSRTMVPLRFVSEALGAQVDWDGETKTVTIAASAPAEAKTYKSKDGWSVKYDPSLITVNETDDSVSFVYTGESAGTNMVEISYIKGKQPQEVLGEATADWDDEKTVRTEGYFAGENWAFYRDLISEGGSGLSQHFIAAEYNDGVILIEGISHTSANSDDEDYTVSDTMANILDSMEFDNYKPQKQFEYIPGVYSQTYTEEMDGENVEVTYTVTLNKDHTAIISLQDEIEGIWSSTGIRIDNETFYEYTIEGDSLYLNINGEWEEFSRAGGGVNAPYEADKELYKSVISKLKKGQYYAFAAVKGVENDILLVADSAYDNMDGNTAAVEAKVYAADSKGSIKEYGTVAAGGTAYPLAVDENYIFRCNKNSIAKMYIDADNNKIAEYEQISFDFDSDGEINSYSYLAVEGEIGDGDTEKRYERMADEYGEAIVINFTEVK